MRANSSLHRRRGLWLALFVLFVYVLSYAGIPHSIDEQATVGAAESLLHGSLQLNRMEWEQERYPPQNAPGTDGNLYSKKGLGSPLIVAPFLFLGKQWGAVGAVQLAFLSTALLTAATVFLFYQLAISLRVGEGVALAAALALGLGTMLWPYAKMLFSEPLAALGLTLALLAVTRHAATRRSAWLAAAGLGLGVCVLARSANAVLALPFAVHVATELFSDWRVARRWRPLLVGGVLFALPLGAAALAIVLSNRAHFGTLFAFPRVPGEEFTTPLVVGVAGLLWSSGKGLLFYVPLAWLAGLSFVVAFRQMRRPPYWLALATIAILLLFYGRWYDWPGGKAWGPRFLVPAMPALVLLGLPAWLWLTRPGGGRWRRLLLSGLVGLSVVVQLPGVLVNFEYQENLDAILFQDLVWQWRLSPLLTFWGDIFSSATDPVWSHRFFWSNPPWLLGLVGLAAALLLLLHAREGVLLWRRAGHAPRRSLAVAGILTPLLAVGLLVAAYGDIRWWERTGDFGANQAVRGWIDERAVTTDMVLLDLQAGYDTAGRVWEWMNYAPLWPDYIGWRRKSELTAADEARLRQWLAPYGRAWLVLQATDVGAADSTTERWLRRWAYAGQDQWVETQRIVEFVAPNPEGETLAAGSAGLVDSAGARLSYVVRQGQTGQHLLLDLVWRAPLPAALKFSVQAIDPQGRLQRQVDTTPDVEAGNRVGMVVPAAPVEIVLRLYDGTTGRIYPIQVEGGGAADFISLLAIP